VQWIFKYLFGKTGVIAGGRSAAWRHFSPLFIAAKFFDEELFSRVAG